MHNGLTNEAVFALISVSDTMKFDNGYSWLKSKKISYMIEVLPPADMEELHTSPSFSFPRADDAAQLSME